MGTAALIWVSAHAAVFNGLLESFKSAAKDQKLGDKLLLPDYTEKLGSAHEIGRTLDDLCALTLRRDSGKRRQLLVVVDDLDRCSPGSIKQVFDAVRLVAHIRGVSVIVALDDRIAYAAVTKFFAEFGITYREASQVSRDYLSKVFNLSVQLEDADPVAIKNYITSHIFEQLSELDHSQQTKSTTSASGPATAEKPTASPIQALPHEIKAFVDFATEFGFSNPRELWRLRQTWSLLKGIALPASAQEADMRVWMRHLFFRERLMQAPNEQRRVATEFFASGGIQAPLALNAVIKNFERVFQELHGGFAHRDPKVLCVLLPAAPPELASPPVAAKV